ncbi:MAG: YkvA family protein [Pseudomonadales bacterium]
MAMHDRTRRSRMYTESMKLAVEYLQNPAKLDALLNRATSKADNRKNGMQEAWGQVQLLVSMLRSYRSGEYKEVSSKTLLLIIAALLYFIMPADLVPDFILGLGYLDDIALLAWTVKSVSAELEKFDDWRKIQSSVMGAKRAEASRNRQGLLIEGEIETQPT